ncbi:Hexosaminidase domain-containing protein [Gryllus bimaculatus]|nr:Hexosaminidase domain-containing protein [Gryllus bimaculatus]
MQTKMCKLRGKIEVTVIAMIIFTLALILYVLFTSDVLVDSSMSKERNSQASALVHKQTSVNRFSSLTLSPDVLASHNRAEERIMDDVRRDSDQDENNLARRVLAPQNQENRPIYYNERNNFMEQHNSVMFRGHRVVHLDLKGAPPRVAYYDELFPLLRSLGATGILIEYEDMFPYSDGLKDLAAHNAYTKADIKHILKVANENELEIIPLIQTFGHLEFVLKLEKFSNLREVPKYPQVVCPSNNDTFPVLAMMINQIMKLHPHIKHLHIGCDEVYYLGNCIRCGMAMVDHKWAKTHLFLNHVIRVAKYVRKHFPNVMPLTWDDEFRKVSEEVLQESRVSQWLEPVVWKYSPDLVTSIGSDIWEKYISVFPAVWVASAFKGATGPDKYVTDISYHLENHRAWMDVINSYSQRIKFRGIMLTGWQRYDHFAILCELLPVGLPSLATNLAFIQEKDKKTSQILRQVMDVLKCDPPLPLSPGMGLSHCGFPGAGILEAAERLYILQQNIDKYLSDSAVKGWFTDYNIEHGFASPSLVERATAELNHCKMELGNIKQDMITAMSEVYDSYTTKEWISTYIQPLDIKLQNLWDAKEKLLAPNYWPKRPLDFAASNVRSSSKPQSPGST